MEKPSKRNLFDDDSDDDGDQMYKPTPAAEEKPQADQMEEVKIDQTPVTQEDEYVPQVDAYEPDYVPPVEEEYVPPKEEEAYVPPVEDEYVPPVQEEYVPPVEEKVETPVEDVQITQEVQAQAEEKQEV